MTMTGYLLLTPEAKNIIPKDWNTESTNDGLFTSLENVPYIEKEFEALEEHILGGTIEKS